MEEKTEGPIKRLFKNGRYDLVDINNMTEAAISSFVHYIHMLSGEQAVLRCVDYGDATLTNLELVDLR